MLPAPCHPNCYGTWSPTTKNLCGDLGVVCRWWYFEHHLLRLSPTASFPLYFIFHFRLIYILDSMITPHIAFLLSCLCLCVSMIMFYSPSHNHTYSSLSFLLMVIDIAFLAVLFYAQPCSPIFPFPMYILTSPKGSLTYLFTSYTTMPMPEGW